MDPEWILRFCFRTRIRSRFSISALARGLRRHLLRKNMATFPVGSAVAGVRTGVGFSTLKYFRIKIKTFWNRSRAGVWKSDSGHLCCSDIPAKNHARLMTTGWKQIRCAWNFPGSSVARPKRWEGPTLLTSSEQQYLVWDTASRSTKRQDILELLGSHGLFAPPPGYAYVPKFDDFRKHRICFSYLDIYCTSSESESNNSCLGSDITTGLEWTNPQMPGRRWLRRRSDIRRSLVSFDKPFPLANSSCLRTPLWNGMHRPLIGRRQSSGTRARNMKRVKDRLICFGSTFPPTRVAAASNRDKKVLRFSIPQMMCRATASECAFFAPPNQFDDVD